MFGAGVFAIATGLGQLLRGGESFLQIMVQRAGAPGFPPAPHREMVFNFETLVLHLGGGNALFLLCKYGGALLLCVSYCRRQMSMFVGVFLATCYYLLFYNGVFEYHYTSLIPLFVLGLLTQPEFNHRFVKFWILVACLPTPYVLFRHLQLFALTPEFAANLYRVDPERTLTSHGLFFLLVFRLIPLLLLAAFIAGKALEREATLPSNDG